MALLDRSPRVLSYTSKADISVTFLIDFSGAFDTIDHSCLLQTLKTHFWINGKVLAWIEPYLADRIQTVEMDDTESDVFKVPFGVPQGSRLGPLLFTLYKQTPHTYSKGVPYYHLSLLRR